MKRNKTKLVKIELLLDEDGNLELVRKTVGSKEFVKIMNSEYPEYPNTHIIAAAIKHFEWESDKLFDYMDALIKGM